MKKIITIILLLVSSRVFGQTTPTTPPPANPQAMTTNTVYQDAVTKKYYVYNGSTFLWRQLTDSLQVKRMIAASGGTVTSITPGIGFLSHTPITTSGTINVDTINTIMPRWQFYHGNNTIGGTWDFNKITVNSITIDPTAFGGILIRNDSIKTVTPGTGIFISPQQYLSLSPRDGTIVTGNMFEKDSRWALNSGDTHFAVDPTGGVGGIYISNTGANAQLSFGGDGTKTPVTLTYGDVYPTTADGYLYIRGGSYGTTSLGHVVSSNELSSDSTYNAATYAKIGDTIGISKYFIHQITPNLFTGSDILRVQKAVDSAATTTHIVYIPPINNRDGGSTWLLDSAVRLPANMLIYIHNTKVKNSNSSRDNLFRSANTGVGISSPAATSNIKIIGIGKATLEGADNPRATGDAGKTLTLTATSISGSLSYGSDASNLSQKQTGDWRNNTVVFGYCDGCEVRNLTVRKTHAWGIVLERSTNCIVDNIIFDNDRSSIYNGTQQYIKNRDGVDIIAGGKNNTISNIFGRSGDDNVALNMINGTEPAGSLNTQQVTGTAFVAATDTIHNINISNVNAYSAASNVRVLNTGPNLKAYNINISNITDASSATDYQNSVGGVVLLGDNNATYGGPTPFGNLTKVNIGNIKGAYKSKLINVYGSLTESVINNAIKSHTGNLVNFVSGALGFKNVQISNSQDSLYTYNNLNITGISLEQSIKTRKADSVMLVTDSRGAKGLQYAADYSAAYTSRSLIDRGSADARYGAINAVAGGDLTGTYPNPTIASTTGTGAFMRTVSPTTTGTFTGQSSLWTNTSTSNMAAASNRMLWQTSGALRWVWGTTGTETGANSGSDLQLLARDDAGSNLGSALTITRNTRIITFGGYSTGYAKFSPAGLISSQVGIPAADVTGVLPVANGGTNLNATQTTVSGSTSGNAKFSQPEAGTSSKKVIVYMAALVGTASYTFPTAFTNTPVIVTTNGPAAGIVTALSTTAMTVTGATTTGFIVLQGY